MNNELVRVSTFIRCWVEDNEYEGELQTHNAKFKADFNQFLNTGGFSDEIIQMFLIN